MISYQDEDLLLINNVNYVDLHNLHNKSCLIKKQHIREKAVPSHFALSPVTKSQSVFEITWC